MGGSTIGNSVLVVFMRNFGAAAVAVAVAVAAIAVDDDDEAFIPMLLSHEGFRV